ncbi:MAG: hypothetical protein ACM31C_09655 [Acidobacteriota bacterium]
MSACGGDEATKSAPPITSSLPTVVSDAGVAPVPATVVQPVEQPKTDMAVDVAPLPTKFDDALAQGRELMSKGDHVGAKEMFDAAIKLDKRRA